MGIPEEAETPESRNGHGGDLAELASNLRSSFDSRLPPFRPNTEHYGTAMSAHEQLSEVLKKHHRYTPVFPSLSCTGQPIQT